jgi:anaerobic selenocysteine-containing dehydrogenase
MDVYLEDGRITKVEGMKEHPLNKGVLCPKGEAALEYVYSPDRLKYPLIKKNGNWQRITWDEALDTIADKLIKIKETDGARAFATAIGMPVLLSGSINPAIIRRFCYIYGSPNCFSVESMCYRSRIISYMLTYGRFRVADPVNAKLILLWASNPLNSFPTIGEDIRRSREKGAKLIVIDPRKTPFAKQADIHVTPRPGSDCALLLGVMNVIISEGLYDKGFVDKWTVGFDKLVEHVKSYSPEKVEKLTGVAVKTIQDVARMYATTRPACIVQGTNALDQQASGLQNGRAVSILQAITGNIDVAGGFIRAPRLRENTIEMTVRPGEKAIGQAEYPEFFGIGGHEFGEGQTMLLMETLLTGKPYPIKGMIVSGANPLLTWPNSKKVEKGLRNLDFLVVMDQFMSETANIADMVLPAATFMEKTELCDYYTLWGVPWVMLRKKVISYGECLSDVEFWIKLAKRMGYEESFPWKNMEEIIDYVLAPSGLTIKYLTEEMPSGLPSSPVKYGISDATFNTKSGKIEIYSQLLADQDHDPLPTFYEPPESPVSSPKIFQEYPLILTTGARHLEFCHSQFRNMPSLKKRITEPVAEISTKTAEEYHLNDGETVVVTTRRGRIEVKVKVSEDILPGIIAIPHGWAQANVNILTDETPADPVVGYPSLKAMLCKVEKRL